MASRSEDNVDRLLSPEHTGSQRVFVAVAHPDDEVIGFGSRLHAVKDLTLVHATDGAPRDPSFAQAAGFKDPETYADVRQAELRRVLDLAGIPYEKAVRLDLADQDACLHLAWLTLQVAELIARHRPDVVLTHPYEGGHPDHDALAFAVQNACRLRERDGHKAPLVVEMAFYHRAGGVYTTGAFLPGPERQWTLTLSDGQVEWKRRLASCHVSQAHILEDFDFSSERFRLAPLYDFTAPPHQGTLNYEAWGFEMTGSRFRELAANALYRLGLNAPAIAS